jgi:hypothetical protein
VVSTGYLWVQFIRLPDGNLKIGHMDFSCQGHEEYVTRGSIKVETKKKQSTVHLPESPINKWGVPPRVLHILQIADIGPRLSEVVFHSLVSETTPRRKLMMMMIIVDDVLIYIYINREFKCNCI